MCLELLTQGNKKIVFQTKWLADERFKLWLGSDKKSNETTCRLCHNSAINVEENGGWYLTLPCIWKNTRQ